METKTEVKNEAPFKRKSEAIDFNAIGSRVNMQKALELMGLDVQNATAPNWSVGPGGRKGDKGDKGDPGTSGVHDFLGADHTVSGLTTGHFLKASGAASFGFAAHGLSYTDVGAEPTIIAGTATQYYAGNKLWAELNQAAVAGLTTADSPAFTGLAINTQVLYVGGASRFVGIGTTTASQKLQIVGEAGDGTVGSPFCSVVRLNNTKAAGFALGTVGELDSWDIYMQPNLYHLTFADWVTARYIYMTSGGANLGMGTYTFGANASLCFGMSRVFAVAPADSPADMFQMYPADFGGTAGKTCPHIRIEDETIVRLDQDISTLASPTFAGLTLGALAGVLKGTAGVISAITNTTSADYMGGDAAYHTLNQAAVAGLTTASSPTFANVKLSDLTDGRVPYRLTASGFANAPIYTDGTLLGIGIGATATVRFAVKGTGNTSGTYTCVLYDSGGNDLFQMRDDGQAYFVGRVGIGTLTPTTGKLQVEQAQPAASENKPTIASFHTMTPQESGICHYFSSVRTGGGTPKSPTAVMHTFQSLCEDNSSAVLDYLSGALSSYTYLIGNNTGGATSHPDYWTADDILMIPSTHDCAPRQVVGRNQYIEIQKDYTIPAGGLIAGFMSGCNHSNTYTKQGNAAYYAYGRWINAFEVADEDTLNHIHFALDCGFHGIINLRKLTADPAVADMEDQEIAVGIVSGTAKIYWKNSTTIYVWTHDATIT